MKKELILFMLAIFMMSANVIESITNRSTDQVIFSSDDIPMLKTEIIDKYKHGYRVVSMVSQSKIQISMSHTEVQKGVIIVVMEK